ncbi:SusC/RagA family TonB-linked outer membrane protein [Pedobacter hiemivivus]|uniref:SusC/RagA family TonB-linked outer membrane protein n=1 Tax=Pedobacter hiemivivus TaxID=2530454 RepID=A0A4V5PDL3_9SPHI|nr:SusC/RagA family TonB-linked outer membrane protein [Pedobacter hiemivivus]TKC64996.1 SusC/RagA family TonB-linked outer membrane protein [Pedobacter hiemivivus]
MKHLLLLLMACSSFLLVGHVKAQTPSDVKITLNLQNQNLRTALSAIQKKSGIPVVFNEKLVEGYDKLNINVTTTSVAEVLDQLLKKTSLRYIFQAKKIVIVTKEESNVNQKGAQFIIGKIIDEQGKPLPGANVTVVELKRSVVTNSQGVFKVPVLADSYTLEVSFISYQTKRIQNVKAGSSSISIVLEQETTELNNVVITALGIKREEKSLGYAVTKVDGEEISKTAPNNWVNALSGKVPGLNISKAGAGPGGTVRITLRGQNSLDLDKGEPLVVIDGVPVISGMVGNNGLSYGATGNTETPVDYGNALSEINPEDIKDVTILRGPSAAALYGSRAASGAILITTKSNTDQKEKLSVAFNSGVTLDDVLHYPDFQYEYGAGNAINTYFSYGASPDGPSTNSTRSFGPAFAGQSYYQYDPVTKTTGTTRTPWVADKNYVKDAFVRGVTYNNNLSLSGGDSKNSIRLSYNDTRNKYILPNTGYSFNRLSFSSNSKLNNLQLTTRVNYYHKESDNLPLSGYNTNSFMYGLMYGSANIPFSWHKDYWDVKDIDQNNKLNSVVDNPYFILYENLNTLDQDRIFGNLTATYTFSKKMSLMLRGGIDQGTSLRTNRRPYSSIRYATGRYQEQDVNTQEQNYDLLYKYDEKLSKNIGLAFAAGASITKNKLKNNTVTAERLSAPGIYSLGNAQDRTLLVPRPLNKEVQSIYGLTQFNYKTYLFLDLTGRNDWSSTLPAGNNSYFYYSASGSTILTEMLNLSAVKPLSYFKIRGSIAQVGNDTDPYRTGYYLNPSEFGGSYTNPATLPGGDNLKPEIITNREIGADIRFFGSRLGFDLTYYNSNSSKQILIVPNDPATGFTGRTFNAGLINNSGYELAVTGNLLGKKSKLQWKTTLTYSSNRSLVKELAPNVEEIIMATGPRGYIKAIVGGSIGDIYGSGYVRSPDGQIVHDDNGLPLIDTENFKILGSAVPDYKAGIQNQFTYNRFSFSFLFDGQKGGDIYSFSNSVLAGAGKLRSTLEGRYAGIVGEGVVQNTDGTYRKNDIVATAADYYNQKYLRDNAEANIFDASYIKLREVSLEYRFTAKLLKNIGAQSASLSVYGRDLLLFTSFPLYDPEIATLNRNRIEPGFETGQFPSTRSFGATIKASF